MNERAWGVVVAVLAVIVAAQAILFVRSARTRGTATIVCMATNAGVPLTGRDASVLVYRSGERAQPVTEGEVGEAIAVPAGLYDLAVAYNNSRDHQKRWIERVQVSAGERIERQVEFAAGQLAVESQVGVRPATAGEVLIHVFAADDHNRRITVLAPGEVGLLAAGAYDLRVVLMSGTEEKDVRWLNGARVAPGLQTRQTLVFHRGTLLVNAANPGNGLPLDVSLDIYRAGDVQQEVVENGVAGVPIGLAVGRYDVKATLNGTGDSPSRWLRDVTIADNERTELTVGFDAGMALVRAFFRGGEELGSFQAYVYFYRSDEHQQPVTYVSAGQPVMLSSGLTTSVPDSSARTISPRSGSVAS